MADSDRNDAETLWFAEDVAAHIGFSVQYVYKLAREGVIPSFKVRSRRRFRRSDIEAWVESQRPPVEAAGG